MVTITDTLQIGEVRHLACRKMDYFRVFLFKSTITAINLRL